MVVLSGSGEAMIVAQIAIDRRRLAPSAPTARDAPRRGRRRLRTPRLLPRRRGCSFAYGHTALADRLSPLHRFMRLGGDELRQRDCHARYAIYPLPASLSPAIGPLPRRSSSAG